MDAARCGHDTGVVTHAYVRQEDAVIEKTIPVLPCRSITETLRFYRALGFEVTYQQEQPSGYAVVQRGDVRLDFFVLPTLEPARSYATCYVLTPDVDALRSTFVDGLRSWLGIVPTEGIPRISPIEEAPYGVRQFVITDPAGNTVRVGQPSRSRAGITAPSSGVRLY